jgi:hypothetical protein
MTMVARLQVLCRNLAQMPLQVLVGLGETITIDLHLCGHRTLYPVLEGGTA